MNKKAKQDIFVCLVIYAFMLFCFVQTFSMKTDSLPGIYLQYGSDRPYNRSAEEKPRR